MSGRIENRLINQNILLPKATKTVANYVPFTKSGNSIYISGQITLLDGDLMYKGKVGDDISTDQGYQAARICGLNLLTQLKLACQGDLDRVTRVIKLGGFVNCTPEFVEHPKVINGASDLMVSVFGDAGRHSRFAVGVTSLPMGVAVEIDGLFEIN